MKRVFLKAPLMRSVTFANQIQAGAYGEHLFTRAETFEESSNILFEDDRGTGSLRALLEPSSRLRLRLSMRLFAGSPGYAFPWDAP